MQKKTLFTFMALFVISIIPVTSVAQTTIKESAKTPNLTKSKSLSKKKRFQASMCPDISLNEKQCTAVDKAKKEVNKKVTVRLTNKQYETIKKYYPDIEDRNLDIILTKSQVAAPFIPGRTVLSAAISGIQGKRAVGKLVESSGG